MLNGPKQTTMALVTLPSDEMSASGPNVDIGQLVHVGVSWDRTVGSE